MPLLGVSYSPDPDLQAGALRCNGAVTRAPRSFFRTRLYDNDPAFQLGDSDCDSAYGGDSEHGIMFDDDTCITVERYANEGQRAGTYRLVAVSNATLAPERGYLEHVPDRDDIYGRLFTTLEEFADTELVNDIGTPADGSSQKSKPKKRLSALSTFISRPVKRARLSRSSAKQQYRASRDFDLQEENYCGMEDSGWVIADASEIPVFNPSGIMAHRSTRAALFETITSQAKVATKGMKALRRHGVGMLRVPSNPGYRPTKCVAVGSTYL